MPFARYAHLTHLSVRPRYVATLDRRGSGLPQAPRNDLRAAGCISGAVHFVFRRACPALSLVAHDGNRTEAPRSRTTWSAEHPRRCFPPREGVCVSRRQFSVCVLRASVRDLIAGTGTAARARTSRRALRTSSPSRAAAGRRAPTRLSNPAACRSEAAAATRPSVSGVQAHRKAERRGLPFR